MNDRPGHRARRVWAPTGDAKRDRVLLPAVSALRRAAWRTAAARYAPSYPRTRTSHRYREQSSSSWLTASIERCAKALPIERRIRGRAGRARAWSETLTARRVRKRPMQAIRALERQAQSGRSFSFGAVAPSQCSIGRLPCQSARRRPSVLSIDRPVERYGGAAGP